MYNAQGSFARKQLEKHGWTEGSGLGTNQQGISQAIKVKIKKDSTGVGHDPGKEFTDHWWNHVYNKAASRLVVEENEDGVVLKKKEVTSKERTETAKKTLYSNFIKSSTLSNGTETKVEKEGSNSEDESHRAVPTLLLPDDELLRICGGRTGHKGARHGLKLTGKLARLEEQEKQLLMERKGNPSAPTPSLTTLNGATEDSPSCAPDDPSDSKRDGKCKKRRRDERENEDGGIEDGVALGDDSDKKVRGSPESEDSLSVCQRKKKKKRRKAREESEDEDGGRRRKEGEEGRNDEASAEKETGKGRGDREETERAKKKRKKEERVDGEGEENDRAEEKRKKKERTAAECEENGKEEKKRKKKESVDNVSGKKRKEEREDRGQSENETEKKARKKGLKTENDGNTVTTEASRSPRDTEEEEERERAKVKRRKKQSKIRSTHETGDICSTSRTEAKLEETCTHTSIIAPTSSDLHDDDEEEEEEERKEKRKKSKKKKKSKSDVC